MMDARVRRLRSADYRRMPWRNGGGTTTEIVVVPEPSSDRFRHRVSIAEVTSDGPFSRFDGYDRHIMVIAGAGMTLDCGEHGTIALGPFVPQRFSGDWDVHGTLVDGPVRDFNVIVDRARESATLSVETLTAPTTVPHAARSSLLVHVLSGNLEEASEGESLIAEAPIALVPREPTRIVLVRITSV
jgi:environmental stress-induced protein Ves